MDAAANLPVAPARKLRLAYLVTHPIQYQAPLLRRIAAEPDIELKAFFATDFSARPFVAKEFNRPIVWDVPLLEGYAYEVLPRLTRESEQLDFWRPVNYGFARRLAAGNFDALWIHGYARFQHWLAIAAARRRGIAVLLRDEATAISAPRGRLKTWAKRKFFAELERRVDAFLAIGSLNRRYYIDNAIPPARIFRVPYAVDTAHFRAGAEKARGQREALRAELGLEPGRPVILFAAKLIPRKRPFDLIEALARSARGPASRRPYLVLAGDGPLKPELEAMAARLAPGAVKFVGFIGQQDLPRYYDLADVFALPSEYEAWGLVVNEVMCAGRAVVVSDRVGAGPDLILSGENGAVHRMGDVAELARALGMVLESPERTAAMGKRSLEIINRWSFEEDVRGLREALAFVRPWFKAQASA